MSRQDLFDRLLESLHDAMLDDARWPAASALVDELCESRGNILVSGEGGLGTDLEVYFARCCYRGERREEFEDEYFRIYHHIDERGPRLRRLPDSRITSIEELYTDEEKKTSVAYNEMLTRSDTANCLHARMDGPNGSRIIWTAADPVDHDGWSPERVETLARILPHIRQYVRVRLALVSTQALGSTMAGLLENTRCGIVQLDRPRPDRRVQRTRPAAPAKRPGAERRPGRTPRPYPGGRRQAPADHRRRAPALRRSGHERFDDRHTPGRPAAPARAARKPGRRTSPRSGGR